MEQTKKVVIMAGGTGGHIFPGLALADALKEQSIHVDWLGAQGLEGTLVPARGYQLYSLPMRGLRGKGIGGWIQSPVLLWQAVRKAKAYLQQIRPDCVIGFGGFASVPGGIAARLLKIPLLIHEQNACAGLSNRLLSRWSTQVLSAFPCNLKNTRVIGNPVRAELLALEACEQRYQQRDDKVPLRILIMGGSQGARALNQKLPHLLASLPYSCDVWHQTGTSGYAPAMLIWQQLPLVSYRVEPFIEDMASAYAWADLVICRAGASTISELAAVGVASVLIPFPHAVDDHQTANARYLSDHLAAFLCPETALDGTILSDYLHQLTRANCLMQAKMARKQAHLNATTDLLATVISTINSA